MKRYCLSDQPGGWTSLGDRKEGKKISIPPEVPTDLHRPGGWSQFTAFVSDQFPRFGLPDRRLDFENELRRIRFAPGDGNLTECYVTPTETVVSMRRGLELSPRCRAMPLRVYLGVYNGCNAQCSYCCAAATSKRKGYLTVREVDVIVRFLHEMGVVEIRLGESGEPTQLPEFEAVAEAVKSNGMFLSLNTNGMMTDARRQFIAKSGCVDLVIQSLDGVGEAHDLNRGPGSFAQAMKTVEAVHKDVQVRFNYVVNSKTQASLEQLAQLAWQYRAQIYTLPMRPSGRGTAAFERFLEGVSWEQIIMRIERLRRRYPGLVLHSTYDVFVQGGDYLVDHAGGCPAGVEGCCLSPVVEDRGPNARIRMFGCTFMADIKEGSRHPFVATVFDGTEDLQRRFFDVWQEEFEPFRGARYKDATCMGCTMLKGRRCTGHCPAIGHYRVSHPSFDPSVYCALHAVDKIRPPIGSRQQQTVGTPGS